MRLLVTLLLMLLALGVMARGVMAQQVSGLPRVGVLNQGSPTRGTGRLAGNEFREGMRSLGWIEGRTVAIEARFANDDPTQLAADAAELATEKVDVIVAISGLPARVARQATSTIPIVTSSADPHYGFVASLARPGGNVTGLSIMAPDLIAKQLQLLKEAVPRVSKIGVLLQPDSAPHAQLITELERAAAELGVSAFPVAVGKVADLPHRFDEMTAASADAYFVLSEPRNTEMRDDIAALALRHRLPGAAQDRRQVEAGVLLCYGVNYSALHRRLAYFVDKILKGAKPSNLPVEQPTTIELVVNMKTAKAIGLDIPSSILARADEVIE
jgi:putative tryptophan/tyrosine transport system substrate-binding protein